MDWIHVAFIGSCYVGGSILFTLVGLFVARRLVPHHVLSPHNDVAGFIYATIAVTYAVILGFVTITVWEQFQQASENADREANVVADLYRLASWLPESDGPQIQQALQIYAHSVVDDEWTAMDKGEAPAATTDAALNHLWDLYLVADPQQGAQVTAYDDSLERLQELGNTRRIRLLESQSGIPGILWIGLIAGGAITVTFAFGFGVERGPSHAVMLATLAASVSLLLFMISTLDHAFHGDLRVQPDGMELVLRQFNLQ